MEPVLIIIPMIILVLVIRLLAGACDGGRVEAYVRDRGWELVEKRWDPFGPGWFGEKNARIYQIMYRDQNHTLHRAHVKTSMLSGVYLTEDRAMPEPLAPAPHAHSDSLKTENERLRQRIRELERKKS